MHAPSMLCATMRFEVVRHAGEIPSTMDAARRLAEEGAPEGAAVVADRQTAGRGRAGRTWVSPEGGAYLGLVLRPAAPPARWSFLPLALGLGAHDAIARYAPAARLKWPNDVVVPASGGWKKIAGVLVESQPPRFAVAGVGVNVATRAADLPDVATSLAELGVSVERERFLHELLACLEARYRAFLADEVDALARAWSARSSTLGARVAYEGREGVAVRLTPTGALVVRGDDGAEREVTSGDVTNA